MSYLGLPVMLETGMFTEAHKQMRAILHFHISARRDALDMTGRAFQFANYMRVIELNGFVERCKK
jgi:hypothetical protein